MNNTNFRRKSLDSNNSNKKIVIRRKSIKPTFVRQNVAKKTTNKGKKRKSIILKILWWFLLLLLLVFAWGVIFVYNAYIKDLPKISELENIEIPESSVIYDKDWNILYKIFTEKRTYVEFEEIWDNMINALIAWEDKRYWENPWVDVIWLLRAFIYWVIGKNESFWGTSTITQQLIRNTIIENRSSKETNLEKIERKIKEIYLAYQLTDKLSKEKIIELYLNKIGFWSNAYWIEQASQTFFNKSAKELNVLESSILASLPKWPTYYSPYTHPDRLLGYVFIFKKEDESDKTEIISSKDVEQHLSDVEIFKNYISNLKWKWVGNSDRIVVCGLDKKDFKINLTIDNDWCSVIRYQDLFSFLNWIRLDINDDHYLEYEAWRKDFILWRMLEDWYINFEDWKESIINSIWYLFNQEKENIKAPHFVFFVKEYLETKYGKEIISAWGFHIYTTLDSDLQNKAEEIIKKQVESNSTRFNATNAALISLDNKNWDILAMVWGVNYFDQENKWNVNIITSALQPWSSFKPFVYSIWIYNRQIWSKTPIYDLKTTFPWDYAPKNFDWTFLGKMNISTALNHSRNIPAIKMFYMAWWEKNVVAFMRKLWVMSLKEHWQYGAPLALWTWEMTPLELASAYSIFANLWEKVEINPILKIVDSKWNTIEQKTTAIKEKVISESQTYIINSILSDTTTRPSSRNNYISMPDRPVASKTWTSTKQFEKNWKKDIYPANLWTIWYTPQITTVVWAWNTDGSQVWMSWDGLNWAGPIWRDFMNYAHKWKTVENWKMPASVYKINISEVSWLLPNPENSANSKLVESSLFVNKPIAYDNSYQTIEIDALCDWLVWPNTPQAAIKYATLLEFHSIEQTNATWEASVQEWARSDEAKERYWTVSNLITRAPTETCNRQAPKWWNVTIKSNIIEGNTYYIWENYLEIAYNSDAPIKSIDILISWTVVQSIDAEWKKQWTYRGTLFIPWLYRWQNINLEVRAVDQEFYSNSETNRIFIGTSDTTPPKITITNPTNWSIKLYEWDFFNLRWTIEDTAKTDTIIYINWQVYNELWDTRRIEIAINEEKNMEIWEYLIKIISKDISWNLSEESINLEIMRR